MAVSASVGVVERSGARPSVVPRRARAWHHSVGVAVGAVRRGRLPVAEGRAGQSLRFRRGAGDGGCVRSAEMGSAASALTRPSKAVSSGGDLQVAHEPVGGAAGIGRECADRCCSSGLRRRGGIGQSS